MLVSIGCLLSQSEGDAHARKLEDWREKKLEMGGPLVVDGAGNTSPAESLCNPPVMVSSSHRESS